MKSGPRVPYRAASLGALMVLAAAVGITTWSSPAQSTPERLSSFNKQYGTARTRLDSCLTCHSSASSPNKTNLNAYGTDFLNNNHDFGAIEGLDSDGDGASNIDEIKARTFPGDPKENPNNPPPPPPPPPTTTTTTKPSPVPALPKLPLP